MVNVKLAPLIQHIVMGIVVAMMVIQRIILVVNAKKCRVIACEAGTLTDRLNTV